MVWDLNYNFWFQFQRVKYVVEGSNSNNQTVGWWDKKVCLNKPLGWPKCEVLLRRFTACSLWRKVFIRTGYFSSVIYHGEFLSRKSRFSKENSSTGMEPSPNILYCSMNSASAYEHVRLWVLPKGVIFCLWARIFILHVLSFAKKCDVFMYRDQG